MNARAWRFSACKVSPVPVAPLTRVAALSHTGSVRRGNQDAWSYSVEAGVFVVCDGMGGAAGGEIASRTAADAFLEHMVAVSPELRTPKSVAKAVCAANRRVQAHAAQDASLAGMGTTLIALAGCGGDEMKLVHVGDSRCYRWRAGTLSRETEDHSLVAEQLRMGVIDEEQAALSPMRNIITRSVGTRRSVDPEIRTLPVEPGDLLLLCTDGLFREVPDEQIAELLAELLALEVPLQELNEALLNAALGAGGRDNITSLLIEIP